MTTYVTMRLLPLKQLIFSVFDINKYQPYHRLNVVRTVRLDVVSRANLMKIDVFLQLQMPGFSIINLRFGRLPQ
jgi:hypothetical protein